MKSSESISTDKILTDECILFHKQIFNFIPSEPVINHYIKAHHKYDSYINKFESGFVQQLCKRHFDLESVEFFWRFLNSKNALTQKKMVLFSICELYPKYKNHYSNFNTNNLLKALTVLTYHSIRSCFKLAKGSLIYFYAKVNYEHS